jgi:hypothetical protein
VMSSRPVLRVAKQRGLRNIGKGVAVYRR